MKVLIIGQLKGFYTTVSGGPERAFRNQIIAFSKYGSKHIITAAIFGFRESQIHSFSQRVHLYPIHHDVSSKPIFSVDVMNVRRILKNLINSVEPDLVLLHDPVYIMLLSRNISNVSTFLHGPFWLQSTIMYPKPSVFIRLLYRRLIIEKISFMGLKKSNYIICVTRYLKEALPHHFKSKALVLENPVDEKFLSIVRKSSQDKDTITVLSVGRLVPVKGYETLLYAINRILKKAPYLRNKVQVRIVAGYQRSFDWYYRKIQKLIDLLNLNNTVKIITNISGDKELLEEYANADIYVHTSFSEGLPNAIQEAMASQLPVIASRVGGIPDVISDGYNGLLFQPGNVNSLVKNLLKVINDEECREFLGKNGRRVAKARWHPSVYIRILEMIIDDAFNYI
jgi:glycosyltransferase involved in cell wall biosynthesis